jgi:hypothetical protein
MLKSIPKSNISRRSFKVYKRFSANQSEYTPISASSDVSSSLYRSIQKKYYTDNGLIQNYGVLRNPANFQNERIFPDEIYIIDIPQVRIGEKIKPGSVQIIPSGSNDTLIDDGYGKITLPNNQYLVSAFDANSGSLDGISGTLSLITQEGGTEYLEVISMNLESGELIIFDVEQGGQDDPYVILSIDFESGTMVLANALDIEGTDLASVSYGNVFYSDGLIVLNATVGLDLSSYSMEYRSTQTIHETEILVEAKAGEFNYSQNPSAVEITLSGSYDFTTTPIPNVSSAKTVKIKEVRDISQRQSFYSTYNTLINGSWNDYDEYRLTDPTGSYLAPYVTTIGIYDKDGDMIAVAKLPQPIKNLPDYDLNFIVRLDI